MALHKTIAEIRAMPYKEYRSWELYSVIEPFGWQNDEYRTAAGLAMLYNMNRGKNKIKEISDFMRDIPTELLKQSEPPPELSRDELIKQIKKDFGL